MTQTIKIRFTEPQIALIMRAYPNCNLGQLTEVSFEFDQAGRIIDCIGTIKDGGNIDHNHAGSGLARLYEAARRRIEELAALKPEVIFAAHRRSRQCTVRLQRSQSCSRRWPILSPMALSQATRIRAATSPGSPRT